MYTLIDQDTVQWAVLIAIIIAALASCTHVISCVVRNLTFIHDTQRSVAELHNQYARDLMRLRGHDEDGNPIEDDEDVIEAIPIDDAPAQQPETAAESAPTEAPPETQTEPAEQHQAAAA